MNKKSRTHAKRAVRIRLTLVYMAMILSVALLVGVLYLFVQGYRFNRYEGQLEQGGLVQFNSTPNNASVWLDGAQLGVRTQGRLTIAAGNHTIGMQKDGYHNWGKDVTVKPGNVLWLDYVRLVPKVLQADAVGAFGGVASSMVSQDNKKLAVIEDATKPVVQIMKLDTDSPQKTTVTIASTNFTAPLAGESQAFELAAWAHDNRYALITYTHGSSVEWLSVDTASTSVAKNITTTLGVAASRVVYAKDDANTVFLLDSGSAVRRANVDQKTLSGPLVENVESFDVYDSSTVTYVTKPAGSEPKRTVAYLTLGAKKPRVVAEYASSDTVRFAIGTYDGGRYLVVASGETVRILTGDLAVSDAERPAAFTDYATFTITGGATYIGFSPDNQRFVYAQNDANVATLDLDVRTVAHHSFVTAQSQAIQWLDKHHFATVENGSLTMYDFDGTNGHVLAENALTNSAVLTPNGRHFYVPQTVSGSAQLTRVTMILD